MNSRLASLGIAIIFVGLFVVALGTLVRPGGSSSGGGFILIGPVPIVFGSGPDSGILSTVALVVTAVMVALYFASFLIWRSRRRREAGSGGNPNS